MPRTAGVPLHRGAPPPATTRARRSASRHRAESDGPPPGGPSRLRGVADLLAEEDGPDRPRNIRDFDLPIEDEDNVEEEEDPFKDVPKPVADTLRGLTQVIQRMDSKIEDIAAEMSELRAGGRKRKRGESSLGDIEEDDDDDRRVPMRGAYGKCEPLTVRFAYLDSRVRDAAIAGTLPPESLPLLIPPTADIFRPAPDDLISGFVPSPGNRTLRLAAPTRSAADIVTKFMAALPTPAVFLYAWVILVELMVHGLGSPEEAPEAYSALMWYGKWIVDKSIGFTWESICRYHLRVCSGRFAGTFHVDQWYKAIDTDAAIALVRKSDHSRSDAGPSSPTKGKSKTTNTTRRPAAGVKRDVSKEGFEAGADEFIRWLLPSGSFVLSSVPISPPSHPPVDSSPGPASPPRSRPQSPATPHPSPSAPASACGSVPAAPSPPPRRVSSPVRLSSPPRRVPSPARSPPRRVSSPVRSPPRRVSSPVRSFSPPRRVMSPARSPLRRVMSPVRFVPSSPAPPSPDFEFKPASPLYEVDNFIPTGIAQSEERYTFPFPTGTEPPENLRTADPLEVWATLVQLAQDAGVGPTDDVPVRPNTTAHYPLYDMSDTPATASPLRADIWQSLLGNYPDRQYVNNIVGMINHGAKLGYVGTMRYLGRNSVGVRNLPMDDRELQCVRDTVEGRVSRGQTQIHDPFTHLAFVCSPIGTVPKAGGKIRPINHLSWPRKGDESVNHGIDSDKVTLKYETLDPLFTSISTFHGPDTCLWKGDLKDAYWHIAVASGDAPLLGFHLDGVNYIDCTLNFGGKSSPFIFNYFAEGLHWILASFGLVLSHYLDDFFGQCHRKRARATLRLFKGVCLALGLAVSDNKTMAGSPLEILGIHVDTVNAKAWITEERKKRLVDQLKPIVRTSQSSVDGAQSLAGSLLFVSRVCPTGRAYLRGVYDWIRDNKAKPGFTLIKTRQDLLDDLRWWKKIFTVWEGISFLDKPFGPIEIWTDAATTKGTGGHLGPKETCTEAFAEVVHESYKKEDIMFLETLALLQALRLWGPRFERHLIHCKVDNQVLEWAIRKGSCRHRRTQRLVREIFALALQHSLTLVPHWIPSEENSVADALSRFDVPFLTEHYPHVLAFTTFPDDAPLPIPYDERPPLPRLGPPKTDGISSVGLLDNLFAYDRIAGDDIASA